MAGPPAPERYYSLSNVLRTYRTRLRPVFELFATNRAYAGITFVWLPAADAAPAGPALAAPFFYTFAQGQLVYGDTLTTEQQVRGVLHALHAHA